MTLTVTSGQDDDLYLIMMMFLGEPMSPVMNTQTAATKTKMTKLEQSDSQWPGVSDGGVVDDSDDNGNSRQEHPV